MQQRDTWPKSTASTNAALSRPPLGIRRSDGLGFIVICDEVKLHWFQLTFVKGLTKNDHPGKSFVYSYEKNVID